MDYYWKIIDVYGTFMRVFDMLCFFLKRWSLGDFGVTWGTEREQRLCLKRFLMMFKTRSSTFVLVGPESIGNHLGPFFISFNNSGTLWCDKGTKGGGGRGVVWLALNDNKEITSLSVSWFRSLLVSKCFGFLVPKFLGFRVSMIPSYQSSISCSLEDMDPESKFFKNLLNGSSGCSAPAFSNENNLFNFPKFWNYQK